MTEATLTIDFKHAIEKFKPDHTVVFELKMVKGNRFPLSSVKEHQVKGLLDALQGLWYKLADMSAMNGFGAKKPFDAVWVKCEEAYVVPVFYIPRKRKTAYLIPVKEFLKFTGKTFGTSKVKKSIKEEELSRFVSIEL